MEGRDEEPQPVWVDMVGASRLRQRRQAKGWSVAELARRANVDSRVIYRLERSIAVLPRDLHAVLVVLGNGEQG